jgi:hypothetical protein
MRQAKRAVMRLRHFGHEIGWGAPTHLPASNLD